MNNMIDESTYEALERYQFAWFLDVTPKEKEPTWKLLGFGITEGTIEYNPQITTEKFIIHKSATSKHESNQKQSDVSLMCYKGEPIFEYINGLRDKTGKDVQGRILEVDMWNGTENDSVMKFPSKKSNCITPVTSFLGERAEIGFSIYFNGDPISGTSTISGGEPSFIESV